MLLLTNGIARNSALSYEHVCDVSLIAIGRFVTSLFVALSPHPAIASTLSVSLSFSIYLSRCLERRLHRSHGGVLRWQRWWWRYCRGESFLRGRVRHHGSAISFCGSLGCGWWDGNIRLKTVVFQLLDLKRMSRCWWPKKMTSLMSLRFTDLSHLPRFTNVW